MKKRGSTALIRFILVFAVLFGAFSFVASPFPRVSAFTLRGLMRLFNTDYQLRTVSVEKGMIQVHANSEALRQFEKNGEPGPAFTFDFTVDGRLLNMYPVLATALLLALPGQRARRVAAALLVALLLSLFASMFDLYMQCQWQHARVLEDLLPSFQLPSTPVNEEAYTDLLTGLERLQRIKSFLAAGGRQFFAVLAALLAGTACLRPR